MQIIGTLAYNVNMLGVCCHWLKPKTVRSGDVTYVNAMNERSLQLGRFRSGLYTLAHIKKTYIENINSLLSMLPQIAASGIKLFRVSSSLFPLCDKVDRSTWENDEVMKLLANVGNLIKKFDMRVTTHPGQFCVISSDNPSTVTNSVFELTFHAMIFDAIGLPRSPHAAINIHGGKSNRTQQLIDVINILPDNVRSRLTLENDESSYSVLQLLEVHFATGVPIVFDSHHHTFNDDDLTLEEACAASIETWAPGIVPLQHISNTEPELVNGSFTDRRKHSQFIHSIPEPQLSLLKNRMIDVEVEAKQKNLAVLQLTKDFGIPLF